MRLPRLCLVAVLLVLGAGDAAFSQERLNAPDEDVIRALSKLGDAAPHTREQGVHKLIALSALAEPAVDGLVRALGDDNVNVRRYAAQALDATGTQRLDIADALLGALEVEQGDWARRALIRTWLKLPLGRDALEPIRRIETSQEPDGPLLGWAKVARWAVTGSIDVPLFEAADTISADDVDPVLAGRARRVFIATAQAEHPPLADMADRRWQGRFEELQREWFGRLRPDESALEFVVDALRNGSEMKGWMIEAVLDRMGPARRAVVPELIAILDEGIPAGDDLVHGRGTVMFPIRDWRARMACRILEFLGPDASEATPALLREISHPHVMGARIDAAAALARVGRHVVPELVRLLDPPRETWPIGGYAASGIDLTTHEAAARALAGMGAAARPALPALERLARSLDTTALMTLADLGHEARPALRTLIDLLGRDDAALLPPKTFDREGVTARERADAKESRRRRLDEARRFALHALGRTGHSGHMPAAAPHLNDADPLVRCAAAGAVVRLSPAPAAGSDAAATRSTLR